MSHFEHVIPIHPQAPGKVAEGVACNGCGVCCLFEPCPLGILLFRSRTGACRALHWDDTLVQYRCGAVVAPRNVLVLALPDRTSWLAGVLAPLLRRAGLRWIAAGSGCDSSLEVVSTGQNGQTQPTMLPSELPTEIRAVLRTTHHD
jgi:hypothetical protein